MYNKLFTKILDSSIWLETTPTRLVWITLIAAMDQDGYAHFSAVANLASRARVSLDEAQAAVDCFTSPDPNSEDQGHDGRRIERVPGGFMILNAEKYKSMVTAAVTREQTRNRVQKHRDAKRSEGCNAPVTQSETQAQAQEASNATAEAIKPSKVKSLATESKTTRPRPGDKSEGAKAWEQYAGAYRARYHVDPVRNAKTNGQFAHLVARLGSEAGDVAAHYVASGAAFYVQRGHAVDNLIRDAEKLRMEWATGRSTPDGRIGNGAIGKTAAAVFDLENLKDEFNGMPR